MFVLLGSESLAFQLTDTVGTTKSKERGVRSSHLGATEQCGPQNKGLGFKALWVGREVLGISTVRMSGWECRP